MKLRNLLVTCAITMAAGSAMANNLSFSAGLIPDAPGDYYNEVSHMVGGFTDTVSFSVPAGTLNSTANVLTVLNAVPNAANPFSGNISDLDYSIWSGAQSIANYGGGLTTASTMLASGNYTLKITGMADGTHGGTYALDMSVVPVPEPSTYAMLIGGLGLLGFIAKGSTKKS